MQRPRKPGDQAPPARPIHRNAGPTALTHVKSTAGKLYLVHDGDGNILELDGVRAEGLTYDDARRFKDFAVTKHKQRRAGVREMVWAEAPPEIAEPDLLDPPAVQVEPPNPDPYLERQRQAALSAVRPIAQAANARVMARAVAAPTPKPKQTSVQRAPGWEPPPEGVTAARQAPKAPVKNAPIVRAPGFEAPHGGAKSKAPETVAAVEIDPIDGDDSLELDGTDDVAELLDGGGDLESEVKRVVTETENLVIEACKALKPGNVVAYFTENDENRLAKVVAIHAPTCLTIQLGVRPDMLTDDMQVDGDPDGPVLKSVMLSPKEGKRGGTWQPIL